MTSSQIFHNSNRNNIKTLDRKISDLKALQRFAYQTENPRVISLILVLHVTTPAA